jgi:hypothetical protein
MARELPLAFRRRCGHSPLMKRWTFRQVFTWMLGALLALGMNLSAVQAGGPVAKMTAVQMSMAKMTMAKMAMVDGSATAKHGDCQRCGDTPGTDAKKMSCASACVAPVLAILPQSLPLTRAVTALPSPTDLPLLLGGATSPDPSPPRRGNLA